MAHRAVNTLGLTQGVAHIEFAYTDNGPVLFELGARCGGGHTPQIAHHVSGVNEFVEACRMACGLPPSQFTPTTNRGADYRFLIFPPGEIEGIEIPPSVTNRDCVLDVGITLQPGSRISPLHSTSDRAGFLVAIGANLSEAADCADRSCRQISIRYRNGSVHHASELLEFQELTRS
jgi:biotin carboxylase